MMVSRLPDVADRIYDAAVEPCTWPAVMRELASMMNGPTAVIRLHKLSDGSFTVFALHPDHPIEAVDEYNSRWATTDPFRINAERLGGRRVRTENELAPASGATSADVYNNYYLKWGWGRGIAGYITRMGDEAAIVGFQRSIHEPAYSREELDLAQRLAAHLGRAVEVSRRLCRTSEARDIFERALQAIDSGVILVGGSGDILFMNDVAERVLASRDGFVVERRTLSTELATDASALQAALRQALGSRDERRAVSCTIHRKEGRALTATVMPFGARAAALVVFADPDHDAAGLAEVLIRRHALTPCEARVGAGLCRGQAPAAIARASSTSVHTVRTHLKNIQAKLGVRGQTQIVAELLRGPGFIRSTPKG